MLGLYEARFLLVPHPEGRLAVAISADLRNLEVQIQNQHQHNGWGKWGPWSQRTVGPAGQVLGAAGDLCRQWSDPLVILALGR